MEKCRNLRRPKCQLTLELPAFLGDQVLPWAGDVQNPHLQALPFPGHSCMSPTPAICPRALQAPQSSEFYEPITKLLLPLVLPTLESVSKLCPPKLSAWNPL